MIVKIHLSKFMYDSLKPLHFFCDENIPFRNFLKYDLTKITGKFLILAMKIQSKI